MSGYRAGTPVRQLAEELGINPTTVLEHVRRAGLPKRRERTLWSEADLAQAIARYEQGALLREIGEMLGVHKETVRRRLIDAGVVMRTRA